MISFFMSYPVQAALLVSGLFPSVLMLMTRMPKLIGYNAIQFLLSFIVTTIVWLGALGFLFKQDMTLDLESFVVSFFLYSSAMLIYLEIWGLMSRGYTLGLLLTFYKAGKPLSMMELASLYRGGEGLEWLVKHRLAGLISAKMIQLESNQVVLTTKGSIVAFLYKVSVWFFGLRYTG